MKHLFIVVLLILALSTPASATGWGSGWGISGWGWEEPEVVEEVVEEEIIEEVIEEVEEVIDEVEEEVAPAPDYGLTTPNTAQFLFDNGYSSIAPSGWSEPTVAEIETVAVAAEVVAEPEKVAPIVIMEKVIVYETVYIEKPAVKTGWWHTMEAEEAAPAKVEPAKVVAMVKGISTPETGGGGLFWLAMAAVILGVAIVTRLEGRGEVK